MFNAIPFIGWAISLFFAASLAVPFWFFWTVCTIGRTYGYFLPEVYQSPGFGDCVGVFICMSIIKLVFIPRLVSTSSEAEVKAK